MSMKSFYVRCEPMPLVIGGRSHGTHVFTDTAEGARQVAIDLGHQPREVRECPGPQCMCVADATALNDREDRFHSSNQWGR